MAKLRVGVLLAGSGVKDGSEIHEATLTLYSLDKHGAEAVCMAPDKPQLDVVDHLTGKPMTEPRNVLVESARIARGAIRDVLTVRAEELDAVIVPGGFGAAKNLCTFARDGADCTVDEGVAVLLRAMKRAGKPIGALCIAPALLAALFGRDGGIELTIGDDEGTARALEQLGATHREARTDEVVVDEKNRVVTTPCYMTARGIAEVGDGADKLVVAVLALARKSG
jgi:enhancing lycopene biosynthesis protein 2